MKRYATLIMIIFLLCPVSGWAKWNKKQQLYLDSSFSGVQQKFSALKTDIASLEKELADVKSEQTQLQSALSLQQQALHEMRQMVLSLQYAQTDNSTNFSSTLAELRTESQRSFAALSATLSSIQATEQKLLSAQEPQQPASGPAASTSQATPATAPPTPVSGFVTNIKGDEITISLGSSAGLKAGSRLDLFKVKDPSARVGVLEVTDVVDAGDAHVRVVSITPGVTPEYADIVRPE